LTNERYASRPETLQALGLSVPAAVNCSDL
jgi:hypothetical protein